MTKRVSAFLLGTRQPGVPLHRPNAPSGQPFACWADCSDRTVAIGTFALPVVGNTASAPLKAQHQWKLLPEHNPTTHPRPLPTSPQLFDVHLLPPPPLPPCAAQSSPLLNPESTKLFSQMDSQTPRRTPARNSPAAHEPPFLAGSPKHLTDFSTHAPPPPLPLHTRATNESWDPQPSVEWNTPQSSPTKNTAQLVELFDRNLHLAPSPSPPPPQPTPSKRALRTRYEDNAINASVIKLDDGGKTPGRNDKENAQQKEHRKSTGAAMSRGTYGHSARKKYNPLDELTMEDHQKLAKPSVKRLKDVAHLCNTLPLPLSLSPSLSCSPSLALPPSLSLSFYPPHLLCARH